MKLNRVLTLFIGITIGAVYALFTTLIVNWAHETVSISYIFILPVFLGIVPVLFSTKEQLKSYYTIIILPWMGVITFCFLALITGFEGTICLVVIIAPFLILGSLGAFIVRLIKLRKGNIKTPLYCSLLLPFLVLIVETNFNAKEEFNTVVTTIEINAGKPVIWPNIENVKSIKASEIKTHFVHLIGIPKPLNGELDKEGVGAVRSITWEKGIRFQEIITQWNEGSGFAYNIKVNPSSIKPTTLDEHVMIGGRYFDVVNGSYQIIPISAQKSIVKLTCRYRITTNLNFYSKWWADYILNDFNKMILEVVKKRCEININSKKG